MGLEIERKFLVVGEFRQGRPTPYRQGYLSREPGRTVRVRIAGERGFLTVKSLTTDTVRQEYEYEIPLDDAERMFELCDGPLIEKQRWRIQVEQHVWEVDEFQGANAGLIVAEIELSHVHEEFAHPSWVGREVTHDFRYHNSRLAVFPYTQWDEVIGT